MDVGRLSLQSKRMRACRGRGRSGSSRLEALGGLGRRLVALVVVLASDSRNAAVRGDVALGGGGVRALGLAAEELVLVLGGAVLVGLAGELVLEVGQVDGREDGRLVDDRRLVNLLVDGDRVVNDLEDRAQRGSAGAIVLL